MDRVYLKKETHIKKAYNTQIRILITNIYDIFFELLAKDTQNKNEI